MALVIDDLPARVDYTIGGTPDDGPFDVPFAFFTNADLLVYVDDVLLTLDVDYTVAGAGTSDAGLRSVTLATPISDAAVAIVRAVEISRTTDFPEAGPFDVPGLNLELDRFMAVIQQVDAKIARGVRQPDSDAADLAELPVAAARANKFLGFGTSGELVVAAGTSADLGPVSSFINTLLDDVDATTARATLGLAIGTNVQAQDAELAALAGLTSAANKLPYFTGAGAAALADFSSFGRSLVDDANAAAALATLGIGTGIAQIVNTQTGAVASGTTVIPQDDTIPQNTEGDQYMSLAITPTNASSTLYIDVTVVASISAADMMAVALFQDSTANALAVAASQGDNTQYRTITFRHKMTAGTTSSTTFKIRAGKCSAGTFTFNGTGGARQFGGVLASSITITEKLP